MHSPAVALSILLAAHLAAQQATAAPAPQARVHCLTPPRAPSNNPWDNPDCDTQQTNPSSAYAPTSIHRIPVVVHVIMNAAGQGNVSAALVQSQITVLNEDYRAMAGTPGAGGTDAMIEFYLATTDPNGLPTSGITYTTNNNWFNDVGSYWTTLAWNPNRYLNIYTNTAAGALGYVPNLPQYGGLVGTSADRVVIAWDAFGRYASGGAPYDRGRSATHEVGHYLGLYHTFDNGCGSPTACYTTGDLICDTAGEAMARYGCPGSASSCGSADPIHNYMDYTDDTCMTGFTPEQVRRMRCTLQSYRPQLATTVASASATRRNGAGDLDIYTATAPRLGATCNATVLLVGSGWQYAMLFGFLAPASTPLGNGYTLLVDATSPQVLQTAFSGNGIAAAFALPIPANPALAGLPLSTQAAVFGGNPDFGLTNAYDLVLGL